MMMKRIVGCLLLLTLMSAPLSSFFGCEKQGDGQESDTAEKTETVDGTDSAEDTENGEGGYVALTENKVALYDIVYQTQGIVPDTMKTNDYRELAYKIAEELGKRLEGVE